MKVDLPSSFGEDVLSRRRCCGLVNRFCRLDEHREGTRFVVEG